MKQQKYDHIQRKFYINCDTFINLSQNKCQKVTITL